MLESQKERREKLEKKIFKEIMARKKERKKSTYISRYFLRGRGEKRNNAWNFPIFGERHKYINSRISANPDRINSKRSIPWQIRVKLLKNTKKNLESHPVTYRGTIIWITKSCSSKTTKAKREWVLKERNCQTRTLYILVMKVN